jgi:hypothetical protein
MASHTERVVERSGSERSTGTEPRTVDSRWKRIRRGLEGGVLGTAVMTVYRLPVTRSLPPSAEFWATFVGDGEPEEYPIIALVLHVVYGAVAGAVFAAILPHHDPTVDVSGSGPPSPRGEISTTVYGLLYGLALSFAGDRFVLGWLLDVDPDDRFAFHVGHVLYGITLGAWIGTRTRPE